MTNQEFGTLLRGLASLYETHDKLPQFISDRIYVYVPNKEAMAAAIRALGSGKKNSVNDCLNYQPDRWPLDLWAPKSAMGCQKVEETIMVPRKVIPAQPERIIEAHAETRVTWQCEPFLQVETPVEVEIAEPKLLEGEVSNA